MRCCQRWSELRSHCEARAQLSAVTLRASSWLPRQHAKWYRELYPRRSCCTQISLPWNHWLLPGRRNSTSLTSPGSSGLDRQSSQEKLHPHPESLTPGWFNAFPQSKSLPCFVKAKRNKGVQALFFEMIGGHTFSLL